MRNAIISILEFLIMLVLRPVVYVLLIVVKVIIAVKNFVKKQDGKRLTIFLFVLALITAFIVDSFVPDPNRYKQHRPKKRVTEYHPFDRDGKPIEESK